MIITADPTTTPPVQLSNDDEFTAFLVRSRGADEQQVHALLSAAGAGVVEDGHAWIAQDWIRDSSASADTAWATSFQKMLDFAGSRGWLQPTTGAIRAHIEY